MPDFLYELPLLPMYLVLLAVTGLVAGAMHVVLVLPRLYDVTRYAAGISPVMVTLSGTLFALSVTFLSSAVWQSEDRASEAIASEARSLRIIYTYTENMTLDARQAFDAMIADYARAVRDVEWSDLDQQGASAEAETALARMYRAALDIGNDSANEDIKQPILRALDEISQARETRLTTATAEVSPIQWTVVLVLAFILLVVVATCHEKDGPARGLALTLTTFAIATSLFALVAHDRPFIGPLALTPKPIVTAAGI